MEPVGSAPRQQKAHPEGGLQGWGVVGLYWECLGAEAGGFDQAHLIATGGEFTALIALHHHAATGFDADHTGAHPTKGSGLQNFDHITGL